MPFSASIAIRIVSRPKYRDTYRIVGVPYRYDPTGDSDNVQVFLVSVMNYMIHVLYLQGEIHSVIIDDLIK